MEFTVFRRPHKSGKGWQYKAVETSEVSAIWPPRGYKRCCVIDSESRQGAEESAERFMRDIDTGGST